MCNKLELIWKYLYLIKQLAGWWVKNFCASHSVSIKGHCIAIQRKAVIDFIPCCLLILFIQDVGAEENVVYVSENTIVATFRTLVYKLRRQIFVQMII